MEEKYLNEYEKDIFCIKFHLSVDVERQWRFVVFFCMTCALLIPQILDTGRTRANIILDGKCSKHY